MIDSAWAFCDRCLHEIGRMMRHDASTSGPRCEWDDCPHAATTCTAHAPPQYAVWLCRCCDHEIVA